MADTTINEIKKLPVEERIKKLREVEEQKKKEFDEADQLLKESIAEVERDIKLKSLAIPDIAPVDIASLFGGGGSGLESEAEQAERGHASRSSGLDYQAMGQGGDGWYSELGTAPWKGGKMEGVNLNMAKYHSESRKVADDNVASRGVLESTKKYSKG